MDFDATVDLLKGLAEPTRLRLLALLAGGEATVGELVIVLQQSQPRVSHHLRLLSRARLVDHFRDGHSIYYRVALDVRTRSLVSQVLALPGAGDEVLEQDRARMSAVPSGRVRHALAERTGPLRRTENAAGRPPEAEFRQALDDVLGAAPLGEVLDIGTGSGTVLRLLGAHATSAVGLDTARGMRLLARSRLQEAGLPHCTVRTGDMHALPYADHAFDVVVLDEVLALSNRPRVALAEARRVLRPAGRLLVLDRILPAARRLPSVTRERCLFENQLAVLLSEQDLRLTQRRWFAGRTLEYALFAAAAAISLPRTGTDE